MGLMDDGQRSMHFLGAASAVRGYLVEKGHQKSKLSGDPPLHGADGRRAEKHTRFWAASAAHGVDGKGAEKHAFWGASLLYYVAAHWPLTASPAPDRYTISSRIGKLYYFKHTLGRILFQACSERYVSPMGGTHGGFWGVTAGLQYSCTVARGSSHIHAKTIRGFAEPRAQNPSPEYIAIERTL